jgi:hypothetical protein
MNVKISEETLSLKQKLFCKYCIDERGNLTKAYSRAYKSKNEASARKLGSKLFKHAAIKKKVMELLEES